MPAWEPESLQQSYLISSEPGANGYHLTRIHSPDFGLRSPDYCQWGPYQWMDDDHLLVYPLLGQEEGMGVSDWSYPLVVALDQRQIWVPELNRRQPIRDCNQEPGWSAAQNRLYSPSNDKILAYHPDGSLEQTIQEAGPVVISPSGQHLLTAESWIDLGSGRSQAHHLQQTAVFALAWSSDEKRLFGCCYQYFDSGNGQTSQFELGSLLPAGRGVPPGFTGVQSAWVVSDTYATIEWDMQSGDEGGQVPLIVVDTQAYIDLRDMAGLSPNTPCQLTSISPDRLKVWLVCDSSSGRLVDLTSFETHTFPAGSILAGWSADSQAGLVEAGSNQHVFSATSGDWIDPIISGGRAAAWNPAGHRLAFISDEGKQLSVWDLEMPMTSPASLPGSFTNLVWAPDGSRLVLQKSDGSLWLLPDLAEGNVEQLTPPMQQVGILRWSPTGKSLAFISAKDLYVLPLTP
jgi:WD40 repeat protein